MKSVRQARDLFVLVLLMGVGLGPTLQATLNPDRTLAEWDRYCQNHFPDEKKLLDYEDVRAFIARHRVTNARELVASMKGDAVFDGFLSSYVMVHSSRSAQSYSVDKDHPRVVFFKQGLILGVTDHPTRSNARVEVIHTDSEDLGFHFKMVDFASHQPFVERPTSCVDCHGQKTLPIWNTYRTWPGAHNSAHSYFFVPHPKLALLSEEEVSEKWRRLQELRYRHYDLPPRQRDPGVEVEIRELTTLLSPVERERKGIYAHLRDTGEGTSLLNEFLNNHNFRRISKEMRSSPGYDKYRYAMAAALLECPELPSFLGPIGSPTRESHDEAWGETDFDRIVAEVRGDMESQFRDLLAHAKRIKDKVAETETAMNDEGDIRRIAGWRYLFEKRGVDVKRFFLNFAPGATHGYGFSRVGAGGGGLRFGFCRFIPDLVRGDSELKPLLALEPIGSETEQEKAPMCALLKRKSWAALGVSANLLH